MLVDGFGNVAIVVVVIGVIPVAAVKPNAVCQDLKGFTRAMVWLAVGGCDIVMAADSFILVKGGFLAPSGLSWISEALSYSC